MQYVIDASVLLLDLQPLFTMSLCARPNCQTAAKSSCSGCGREQYCGSACQKLDWKVHKLICPILKRLPNKQQSYKEAVRIINEIRSSNKGNDVRVLGHLLSYADYQFGQPVTGRDYRERSDGQRITNLQVDIYILLHISNQIVNVYSADLSLGTIIRDNKIHSHLERSLHILSPWMVTIDSDATNQSNSLSFEQINYLLKMSIHMESNMALVTMNRNQFDVAEGHCHRCLVNSRRLWVEGEDKTTSIFVALSNYIILRQREGDFAGAVAFAEEAYDLVVDAYDPVHLQVQEAASCLIGCLINQGDYFNAERFAEQTYANLRDIKNEIDQEGEVVAMGAYNLADVILRQDGGDLIKAEKLVRESLRIRTQLHNTHYVGMSCFLLAKVFLTQKRLGDETKELFERSLANFISNEGPDGMNTAAVTTEIGHFYYKLAMTQSIISTKRTQLLLAKSYFEKGTRIETKIHSPTHQNRVLAASLLSQVLNELSTV
jgi:tetratricopeptide (TPR) repeat protein